MSKESMIAVATEAERLVESEPLLLAEQSASIINNAIGGRNEYPIHDTSATAIEAVSSPGRMRQIQISTRNSPSKRPRGRPRNAGLGQDTGSLQVPGAQKIGRLRRPTNGRNQRGTKSTVRATGKEMFEIPEDIITSKTGNGLSREAPNKRTVDEELTYTKETDQDLEFVNSMRQDPAEFEKPKNDHISEPENPVRRGRPKGTTKKSTPIQTRTTNMHTIAPLTRTLRSHASLVEQVPELARKPGISVEEEATKNTRPTLPKKLGKKTKSTAYDMASLVNSDHVIEEGSETEAQRSGGNGTLNLKANGSFGFISPTLESELNDSDAYEDQLSDQGMNGRKDAQDLGGTAQLEIDDRASCGGGEEVRQEALIALDLFGQRARWQRVLNAARSIGTVKKGQTRRRHKIPLETQTIQDFVDGVRDASECYQSLVAYDSPDNGVDNIVESRLVDHLDWLGTKVQGLQEQYAGNKRSSKIQDIYAHAIPNMVFLINRAFIARSALYTAPGEIQYTKEIICLLELTIDLCEKAMSWKVAPKTEVPIKSQTRKVIYPSLRIICNAFEAELEDRLSEKRRMREEAVRAEGYQAREARWEEQEEKCRKERERRQLRGAEDALKISGSVGLRSLSQPSRQAVAQDHWNDEQDEELLRLLEKFQTQSGM